MSDPRGTIWQTDHEGHHVPELLVLKLGADGQYEPVARVAGEPAFQAQRPFPVHVVPGDLLGRLRGH